METEKKLLGMYKQENYKVYLYEDGTKVRETFKDEDTEFISRYPESIDVCLSYRCGNGCGFCYANCTPKGEEAVLTPFPKVFYTMAPFTELALNINSEVLPGFEDFLRELRRLNLIPNITVNQKQFMMPEFQEQLHNWVTDKLIFGIGVSLTEFPSDEFIKMIKMYPNAVIHIINGLVYDDVLNKLSDKGLKILILGYKIVGKGNEYYNLDVNLRKDWLMYYVMDYLPKFKVVSFDNLALEQLHIKDQIPPETWKSFYMGDDGQHTFYLGLAKKRYARSSLETEYFPMTDDIAEMFQHIKNLSKQEAA